MLPNGLQLNTASCMPYRDFQYHGCSHPVCSDNGHFQDHGCVHPVCSGNRPSQDHGGVLPVCSGNGPSHDNGGVLPVCSGNGPFQDHGIHNPYVPITVLFRTTMFQQVQQTTSSWNIGTHKKPLQRPLPSRRSLYKMTLIS